MKKTEGITKYQVQWQLVRSGVKGQKTSLEEKLSLTNEYFEESRTYDRWERVFNWLEGLQRGYKAAADIDALSRIADEIKAYLTLQDSVQYLEDYSLNQEEEISRLNEASTEQIIVLWKDLFRTCERWLKKGYFHKECNAFMDFIYSHRSNEIDDKVSKRFGYDSLIEKRQASSLIENTHNFFF